MTIVIFFNGRVVIVDEDLSKWTLDETYKFAADVLFEMDAKEVLVASAGVFTQFWFDSSSKLHRIGGPAVVQADGGKFWYTHGKSTEPE